MSIPRQKLSATLCMAQNMNIQKEQFALSEQDSRPAYGMHALNLKQPGPRWESDIVRLAEKGRTGEPLASQWISGLRIFGVNMFGRFILCEVYEC